MIVFVACVSVLVLGYMFYGRYVERVFGPDHGRSVPAETYADGVDYVAMPTWRAFMIQLLDVAGMGPVLGPIMGALYGPVALIWVVLGAILAGGVHDYMSGMTSIRQGGASIPEVVGDNLGTWARHLVRFVAILLLVLLSAVFVRAPAGLLHGITGWDVRVFMAVILIYYVLATVLPVDKVIGRLYPLFGLLLVAMTVAISLTLLFSSKQLVVFQDFAFHAHPKGTPTWPVLFIALSCGAISGFHSTQSPLMARCLVNERYGRLVFYGAMILEGIIALVWVTAGITFYPTPEELSAVIDEGTPTLAVVEISRGLLGTVGAWVSVLGVVSLAVTSGDTALRSCRLILADILHLKQAPIRNRLVLAVPLTVVVLVLLNLNFTHLWQYFGVTNQLMATVVLWAGAVYLGKLERNHWICTGPAVFMSAVCVTFLLYSPLGAGLKWPIAVTIGALAPFPPLSLLLWSIASRRKRAAVETGDGTTDG